MERQKSESSSRPSTQRRQGFLRRAAFGQVISINFFIRHWLIVVSVVGLVIFYMAGNYMMRENNDEIERLEKRLQIVKAERIHVRETYMSRIRESSITAMIDSFGLDVAIRNEKPFEIKEK